MQVPASHGLAPPQRIRGQRPAMTVGGGQDGRLKVDPQVIPQPVGTVEVGVACVAQEVLEPLRLGRIEKAEDAALVLAEAPAGQGTEQARGYRVQRPAIFQHLGEMRRSLPVHEPGYAFG